jgi:uncharacterized delta-60 repeat protein
MVITPFGDFYDQANGLALLSGGKILLAGVSDRATSGPTDDDFALARYNADGTLDTSFDGDGRVTTAFGPKNDGAGAVIVTRGGKYVAAGEAIVGGTTDSYAVARYNTNGGLDSTFSGDGKQTVPFGATGNDFGSGVKEQSDGKIVVSGEANSGTATGSDFGLARLLGNGNLDPTFAGDGTVTTDFAGSFDSISELAIQRDGKIVAAGDSVIPGTAFDFTIERLNPNGSLDTTFSGDGKASVNFGPSSVDVAYGLALQANGRILVNGYTSAGGSGTNFALARLRGDEADLRAGLSDRPDPATRGRTVLYTASSRNNGPEVAQNTTLNMALPSRAQLLSAKPSQGNCFRTTGKNLRCEFGTVGSGTTARVSVRVRPIHRPRIRSRIVVASETLDTALGNNRAATSTRIVAPRR